MNHILISSLGKMRSIDLNKDEKTVTDQLSDYRLTEYKFSDSEELFQTSFIIEALIKHEKPDVLLLFGTAGSGWLELYWKYASLLAEDGVLSQEEIMQYREKLIGEIGKLNCQSSLSEFDAIDFEPLCQVLQRYFGLKRVMIVPILYGINRQQILDNFEQMYLIEELLEDGANEIWLDITHAFRSLPFYGFMFINYLIRLSKHQVCLSNVYYGMLEVNAELGYAPVVNLNVLTEMVDWINGISELNNYGSVEQISKKLEQSTELSQWLEVFEYATNTNDFHMLDTSLKKLMKFDLSKTDSQNPPERKFFSTWQEELCQQFSKGDGTLGVANLQYAMGKWYFQQHRYSSCIILLQETVRTLLSSIRLTFFNPGKKAIDDESFRKTSIDYLRNLSMTKDGGDRRPEEYEIYRELFALYQKGKEFRDACAHNLFKIKELETEKGMEQFQKEIDDKKDFIKNYMEYLGKLMENTDWHEQYANDVKDGLAKVNQKKFEKLLILGNKEWENEDWNCVLGAYFPGENSSRQNTIIHYAEKKICGEYMKMNQSKKEIADFEKELLAYLSKTIQHKENCAVVFKSTDYIKQTRLMKLVEKKGYIVKVYGRVDKRVKISKWHE